LNLITNECCEGMLRHDLLIHVPMDMLLRC
jgi:hypothetical protein